MASLSSGVYTIHVYAKGYSTSIKRLFTYSLEGVLHETKETIELQRGTPLSGRVLDKNRNPLANITVQVRFLYLDEEKDGIIAEVKSDTKGRFCFGSLNPGRYRIYGSEVEFLLARSKVIKHTANRETKSIEIQMEEGASISGRVLSS